MTEKSDGIPDGVFPADSAEREFACTDGYLLYALLYCIITFVNINKMFLSKPKVESSK